MILNLAALTLHGSIDIINSALLNIYGTQYGFIVRLKDSRDVPGVAAKWHQVICFYCRNPSTSPKI